MRYSARSFFCTLVFLFSAPLAFAGWELQWIDRFDGDGVDWTNWTAQTQANYNNEVQCYTDDDFSPLKNYDVSDGTLKIIARRRNINCVGLNGQFRSWTSGRLNTKDKNEFLYGRIESRLRFHNLEGGTWPAFWMLEGRIAEQPIAGDGDNVGWPNPGASEIDVWEWFSNDSDSYIINFFNNFGTSCGRKVTHPYAGGAPDVLEWHVYAMEWDADEARFFMDDQQVATIDLSDCPVYEEPMFVLINLAMGGNLGGAIDPDLDLATYEIDYVAHCQPSPNSSASGCNESTPGPFDFGRDADGQWVAAEEALDGHGQGLTFDYMAFANQLFVAWFTYADESSELAGDPGAIGSAESRWVVGQLDVDEDGMQATGPLFAVSGGLFDAPRQPGQVTEQVGEMTIEFNACDAGVVNYMIDGTELMREFPIIPLEKRVNQNFACSGAGDAL